MSQLTNSESWLMASWAPKRSGEPSAKGERRMGEQEVRILCAQKVPVDRRPLGNILRSAGFTVWDASTCAELLRLSVEGPDLIVLEDTLPDRAGVEALQLLKSASASAPIPILFLEGARSFSAKEVEEADGYLGVDAEPVEVLAWARSLLRRKDSLRMESLGRLTSGIIHDFNNLLTVILGHAELLEDYLPAASPEQELLEGLRQTADSAAQLVSQLLSLARQQPLVPQLVDVGALVSEVVAALRRVFSCRIEFVVHRGPEVPPIRAVPGQVMQVLLNLCLNARDAMPSGGRLTLSTEGVVFDRGPFVRLRVMDTGAGISAEMLPHIFEPYFTTRPGHSTGLGLATVLRIMREHQGWIECSSKVGRGSCFDAYFFAG